MARDFSRRKLPSRACPATIAYPISYRAGKSAPAHLFRGSTLNHQIRLHVAAVPGKYNVEHAGAILVADSDAPVIAAAHALKASGFDDHDMLHVVSSDCTWSPMPLHRLTAPRSKPRKSEIDRWQMGMSRN
jgi:hypothetical protein